MVFILTSQIDMVLGSWLRVSTDVSNKMRVFSCLCLIMAEISKKP
jgi:hypothetical protein